MEPAISEELTCPICLEILVEPILLECPHTICKRHLDDLIFTPRNSFQICVECPVCRKETRKEDKNSFRINTSIANIIRILNSPNEANDGYKSPLPSPSQVFPSAPLFEVNEGFSINLPKHIQGVPQIITLPKQSIYCNGENGESGGRGTDGVPGTNGSSGSPGVNSSSSGGNGGNGTDGQCGSSGTHGTNGTHGRNGSDLSVFLSGPLHAVQVIQNNKTSVLDLTLENLKLLSCGGNGGKGGDGGNGGKGGNGGNGGKGGNGKIGGHGGIGGNGGLGGAAGNGGNGGDGGNGGNITLITDNPALFVLVETNVRGGMGGNEGVAGKPGKGGYKGQGGSGGNSKLANKAGSDGKSGTNGLTGNTGYNGKSGKNGADGTVTYVVSDQGIISQKSGKLYSAQISSYKVRPIIDDGVYEPGEEFIVENITITNKGGMSLPGGVTIVIEGTNFVWDGVPLLIQNELPPGATIQLTHQGLRCFIGPETGTSSFVLKAYLCNRLLSDGCLVGLPMEVAYPIRLSKFSPFIQSPPSTVVVTFSVQNLSYLPYGQRNEVLCIVEVDSELILKTPSEIIITELMPGQERTLQVILVIDNNTEYYTQTTWKVHLYLRGTLIETQSPKIQVVPRFNPATETTDVLLVANNGLKKDVFNFFVRLFSTLNLKVNVWDYDYYHGLSFDKRTGARHLPTWVDKYRGKTILFLTSKPDDCRLLAPQDIQSHFQSDGQSSGSALIIVGDQHEFIDNILHKVADLSEEDLSDWYTIFSPTEVYFSDKCKSLEADIELKNPEFRFKVKGNFKPRKLNSWFVQTQYTYGKGSLFKSVIGMKDQFVYISENIKNWNSYTDLKRANSVGGQILLGIVDCLSIPQKVYLLFNNIPSLNLDNPSVTLSEIVEASIVHQLKKEFLYCEEFSLFSGVLEIIRHNQTTIRNDNFLLSLFKIFARILNDTWWLSWKSEKMNKKFYHVTEKITEFEKFLGTLGTDVDKLKAATQKGTSAQWEMLNKSLTYIKPIK